MLEETRTYPNQIRSSTLLAVIFTLTIFSKGFTVEIPGLGGFNLYAYPILFLYFLFFPNRPRNIGYIISGFFLLFAISLLSKIYFSYSIFPLIKQIIPAFIIFYATINYLRKSDINEVFDIYSKIAYLLSVIGLFLVFLGLFGFNLLGDPRFIEEIFGIQFMRLNSLLPEPSHFSVVVLPALIYYYIKFGLKNKRTLTILFALLLTFSLAAYASIFLTLISYYYKKLTLRSILGVTLLIILSFTFYFSIKPIKYRVDETINYSNINNFNNSTNASTFSLITNLHVAFHSLEKCILFGVGLGGHEESYEEYFSKIDTSNFSFLFDRHAGINAQSGHSLLIRIVSELGLFGLIIFITYIYRFRVFSNSINTNSYAIYLGCLSYFIARCFKLGGYFDYGIYFFIVIYYINYAQQKKE